MTPRRVRRERGVAPALAARQPAPLLPMFTSEPNQAAQLSGRSIPAARRRPSSRAVLVGTKRKDRFGGVGRFWREKEEKERS
eukprot:scaffold9837_cov94-Isochrysis_galbana.AAC.1